jgi:hypothetical protein
MKRSFPRLIPLAAAVLLIGACGAAATLPPQGESASLAGRLSEAVWYAENGDHPNLASTTDGVSILVAPPGDDSTYVNGAFSLNVPDADVVRFSAKVGVPSGTTGSIRFSAFVQNGAEFPKLADVPADASGQMSDFVFDLSPFRGKAVLLILSVSSDGTPLATSAQWVAPQIMLP